MEFTGLGWLGVRTDRFEETVLFFRNVIGLRQIRQERDVAGFAFPDGTEVEVWSPEDEFHSFFGTGPVVGFRVEDVDGARSRLEEVAIQTVVQFHEHFWSPYSALD